jgi:hypothetical protein
MAAHRLPAKKNSTAKTRTVAKPPVKRASAPKRTAPTVSEADPRFEPVARAFARVAGFSLMESKSKGMRGLMQDGKSFGMSIGGRFILKLPEERVANLIAIGVGEAMRHGPRVMKGWIVITGASADWVALAKEAHRAARAMGRRIV